MGWAFLGSFYKLLRGVGTANPRLLPKPPLAGWDLCFFVDYTPPPIMVRLRQDSPFSLHLIRVIITFLRASGYGINFKWGPSPPQGVKWGEASISFTDNVSPSRGKGLSTP